MYRSELGIPRRSTDREASLYASGTSSDAALSICGNSCRRQLGKAPRTSPVFGSCFVFRLHLLISAIYARHRFFSTLSCFPDEILSTIFVFLADCDVPLASFANFASAGSEACLLLCRNMPLLSCSDLNRLSYPIFHVACRFRPNLLRHICRTLTFIDQRPASSRCCRSGDYQFMDSDKLMLVINSIPNTFGADPTMVRYLAPICNWVVGQHVTTDDIPDNIINRPLDAVTACALPHVSDSVILGNFIRRRMLSSGIVSRRSSPCILRSWYLAALRSHIITDTEVDSLFQKACTNREYDLLAEMFRTRRPSASAVYRVMMLLLEQAEVGICDTVAATIADVNFIAGMKAYLLKYLVDNNVSPPRLTGEVLRFVCDCPRAVYSHYYTEYAIVAAVILGDMCLATHMLHCTRRTMPSHVRQQLLAFVQNRHL
jgi:hypothetical protein